MAGEIHKLLDEYADSLRGIGYPYDSITKVEAPSKTDVVESLQAAGLNPLPEVVEWFSWGGFPPEDRETFFWETGWIPTLESSLQIREMLTGQPLDPEFIPDGMAPFDHWDYPGTPDWLVVAHLDTSEIVAVNAGFDNKAGAVFFNYSTDLAPSLLMFPSLGDAIKTATNAVQSGAWRVNEGGNIESDRGGMPTLLDLLEPALDDSDRSTRYHAYRVEPSERLWIAVGAMDGKPVHAPLAPYAAAELAQAGRYPTASIGLADICHQYRPPRGSMTNVTKKILDESWELYTLESDRQWGCLLSMFEPDQHWETRRWIPPEQLAELDELGLVSPIVQGQLSDDWPGVPLATSDVVARLSSGHR